MLLYGTVRALTDPLTLQVLWKLTSPPVWNDKYCLVMCVKLKPLPVFWGLVCRPEVAMQPFCIHGRTQALGSLFDPK